MTGRLREHRSALLGGAAVVLLAVALLLGGAAKRQGDETAQRQTAQDFLETLYTTDAVRWLEHLAAEEDAWSGYRAAYAAVATEACQASMEHGLFELADAFTAETGAKPVIDDILLEPAEDGGEGDALTPYFYTVRFHLERPKGGATKTYRAEGTLQLLQYENGAPKVHTIAVNDQNLFRYIQQREALWGVSKPLPAGMK